MHEHWQELISFYVAGSLPPAQARALEQHLAECAACRQTVAEWQVISSAVRDEATNWSRRLPPLSAEVRAALAHRRPEAATLQALPRVDAPLPSQRPPRVSRRGWVPLTALAAILTVILFGDALLFLSDRQDDVDATQVAMLSLITLTPETQEPTATDQPAATRLPDDADLGILIPTGVPATATVTTAANQTPFALATPSPLPPALGSPMPPFSGGGTGGASNLMTLADVCTVTTLDGGSVQLHNYPDTTSEVIGVITAGQDLRTYVRSENGWYQIVEIGPGILGWAPGSSLALSGPCGALPLPTATIADGFCLALIESERIEVRTGPDTSYTVIDTLTAGERVPVIAQSDNGWHRIRHDVTPSVMIGWIQSPSLSMTGDCASLPIVNAAMYDPANPASPVPTATFTPTPEPGQITAFNSSVGVVQRGGSVTISWDTRNTSSVWLEYYGVDQDTGQSGPGPVERLALAPTSGTWTVTIPTHFAFSAARFVIIIDNYDNGLGIPRAELVVTVTE